MKLTHLILVVACVASLPLCSARATRPNGRQLPAPSAARNVNNKTVAGQDGQFGVNPSPGACLTCNACECETVNCDAGVDCGPSGCGTCSPCGSPLGECNASCFCPQIKRRLYRIPCATACCEPPRVGSVLIEALGALRAHMWELKQTGINPCCEESCSDALCGAPACGGGFNGGGLLSGGLLGRCFGSTVSDCTIYDDGCSAGCGGALGCTSCGDACGGSCGGSCGVGFLGGGRLAGFLAACRSRLVCPCPPEGCGTYWGQFDGECVGSGCSSGECMEDGCSGGCATQPSHENWGPTPATPTAPASRSTYLEPEFEAPLKTRVGLLEFLFPRDGQPQYANSVHRNSQTWDGQDDIQTAQSLATSGDFATRSGGKVQIISTQDRRVGESLAQTDHRQTNGDRNSVATASREDVRRQPPVARVDYRTATTHRPGVKRNTAPTWWR